MAALLVGCSSPAELRTSDQSQNFIVKIARGGEIGTWRLAAGAGADATRAWAERDALRNIGVILRREGAAWACEFAQSSIRLSTFGTFSGGDRNALADTARSLGARQRDIAALLGNVLKLSVPDLTKATDAVCP